jgi:hypothetical protein
MATRKKFAQGDAEGIRRVGKAILVQGSGREVQRRLGLPDGFVEGLVTTGDWSFVIKLNALVEAALADYLVRTIAQPALTVDLQKMGASQKARWCKRLGGLAGERAAFVRTLGELRNSLAHNIHHAPAFDLSRYLDSLDDDRHAALTGLGKPKSQTEFNIIGDRRYAVWFSALHVMYDLEDQRKRTEEQREADYIRRRNEDLDRFATAFREGILDALDQTKND